MYPNIRVYSQDVDKGKTLEYDLMLLNSTSDLLFVEGLSNINELKKIQKEEYPTCMNFLRESKENERIKESLSCCTWADSDKKNALLASRYLNSVGKGENALDLSIILKENLEKQEKERKTFNIPNYIKEAMTWLFQ